jgi:hypothetical protein
MIDGSRDRSFVIISPGILKRLVGQIRGDQFFLRESRQDLTGAPRHGEKARAKPES